MIIYNIIYLTAENYLYQAIAELDPAKVYEMIDTLQAEKRFTNQKAYQRMRDKVKNLTGKVQFSDPSPLLDELTLKIGNAL